VGIATLVALAQKAAQNKFEVFAVLSARTQNDLLAADILREYCTEVHHVTEEEKTSDVENVRRLLDNLITSHGIDSVYTCGSKRLSVLSQKMIKEKNLYGQVALEEYMACGVGVCYSCVCYIKRNGTIDLVKSCEEGPV